jgi:hypothetical protein
VHVSVAVAAVVVALLPLAVVKQVTGQAVSVLMVVAPVVELGRHGIVRRP